MSGGCGDCEWNNGYVLMLESEIQKLRKQLDAANEVIVFYGDPENYIERYSDHWAHSSPCQRGDRELIRNYEHPGTDWRGSVAVGGKRAREYLSNLEKDEK